MSRKVDIEEKIKQLERGHLEERSTDFPRPSLEIISYFDFVQIDGISKFWQEDKSALLSAIESFVTGLYGLKKQLAFLSVSEESKIALYYGIERKQSIVQKENTSILTDSLMSLCPGIQLKEKTEDIERASIINFLGRLSFAGALTGIPCLFKDEKKEIHAKLIEKFINSVLGGKWAYLVKTEPISEEEISAKLNLTADEIREYYKEVKQTIRESELESREYLDRLVQRYIDLLEENMERYQAGKSLGMWNTSIYFFAETNQLLSKGGMLLKSIFSGDELTPEPLRFSACSSVQKIPTDDEKTLLNTKEVARFISVPSEEIPGYSVRDYAVFGVDLKPSPANKKISIGQIIDRGKETRNDLEVGLDSLTGHAMISGITGSGKTTTVMNILNQVWTQHGIPFLVIEPAKAEYRALKNCFVDNSGQKFDDLRVFILGDERFTPFRVNPFDFPKEVHVQTHIDLLKSVFNASFVMYAPMQYVLEQCLHEIYTDKGWDLVDSVNRRTKSSEYEKLDVFPTLTDLYFMVEQVVSNLRYGEEITMNVKAALRTRINSLRVGGKGLMLDVPHSFSMDFLLEKPTILELERIGESLYYRINFDEIIRVLYQPKEGWQGS